MHFCSKVYGHEQGLSACFRQWRAESHCNKLHGYALSVGITFQARLLDGRNWVVDFGALKPLKQQIVDLLDHKTLIAGDDPLLEHFEQAHRAGMLDLVVMPQGVGCEAFAAHIYAMTFEFLHRIYLPDLKSEEIVLPDQLAVTSVEVREHGANGAAFAPAQPLTLTNPSPYFAAEHV